MNKSFEKFPGVFKDVKFVAVAEGVDDVIEVPALAEEKLGKEDDGRKVVNLGFFVLWRVPSLTLVQCILLGSDEPALSAQNKVPHRQVYRLIVFLDHRYLRLQVHLISLLVQFNRVYLHYGSNRVVLKAFHVIFQFLITFVLHSLQSLHVRCNILDRLLVKLFKVHFLHIDLLETCQSQKQVFTIQFILKTITFLLSLNFIFNQEFLVTIKIHAYFLD